MNVLKKKILKNLLILLCCKGLAMTSEVTAQVASNAAVEQTSERTSPCDHITIWSEAPLDLNSNEILMLCGDDKQQPWRNIPLYQIRILARSILETRGYLRPEFIDTDGKIDIKAGQIVRVTELEVTGVPFDAELERYWLPIGKPLTPAILDQIQAKIEGMLANHGYPCPQLEITADRFTGYVRVSITTGEKWTVRKIVTEGIPSAAGTIEQRYFAMNEGEDYNALKLQLSTQRLIASGLVLDAKFSPKCNLKESGVIQLDTISGPPRLFSFGFGFDTENYVMSRLVWENSRLGAFGSRAHFQTLLSFRTIKVTGGLDWYYLPFVSRHYLTNKLTLMQRSERQFRTVEAKALFAPAWQRDFSGTSVNWHIGPSFHLIRTERGPGRAQTRLVSSDIFVNLQTHPFEYYRSSPRSGHQFTYDLTQSYTVAGSDINVSRHRISTTHLWNVADLQPPVFILGLRTDLAALITGPDTTADDLPASYRLFLGGMDNVRGFGRNRIPANDQGAMTSVYTGIELRLNEVLPYSIQPFIFTDFAMIGENAKPLVLDEENRYWAPGLGARWESPIGSMRFALGHGFISGPKGDELDHQEQWQFYFSFGDTF